VTSSALDCTVLIPMRKAAGLIESNALKWLDGCPQPVLFAIDAGDGETRSALERWLSDHPLRATIVDQRRPRLSGALNDALEAVGTRYVHWCGADDQAYWWQYPRVSARIGSRSPAWIVGRCETSRPNGRPTAAGVYRNVLHPLTRWLLPLTNTVGCPAIIFSRDLALKAGGFDEATPAAMDYDLWVRLHAVEPPLVLPFKLGRFSVHEHSLTRAHRRASLEDCYRARRRYFRHAWVAGAARGFQAAQFKLQDLLGE
jgi:hypothetical protein